MSWVKSLTDEKREAVFAEMRRLDRVANVHYNAYVKLAPKGGEIAVGGAHFDEFLRFDSISTFLRRLRIGDDPDGAAAIAKLDAAEAVRKWNARREFQVHRSTETMGALIDDMARSTRKAAT